LSGCPSDTDSEVKRYPIKKLFATLIIQSKDEKIGKWG